MPCRGTTRADSNRARSMRPEYQLYENSPLGVEKRRAHITRSEDDIERFEDRYNRS